MNNYHKDNHVDKFKRKIIEFFKHFCIFKKYKCVFKILCRQKDFYTINLHCEVQLKDFFFGIRKC